MYGTPTVQYERAHKTRRKTTRISKQSQEKVLGIYNTLTSNQGTRRQLAFDKGVMDSWIVIHGQPSKHDQYLSLWDWPW